MIDLGLGPRSCAEPLPSPHYPGHPEVRGNHKRARPASWAPLVFPARLGLLGFRSLSPVLVWLAGWLSSPKRNPGTWSNFFRDVALLKAELRLKQHLHQVQTAKWGSFGGSVGQRESVLSHVSHRLQGPLTSHFSSPRLQLLHMWSCGLHNGFQTSSRELARAEGIAGGHLAEKREGRLNGRLALLLPQ